MGLGRVVSVRLWEGGCLLSGCAGALFWSRLDDLTWDGADTFDEDEELWGLFPVSARDRGLEGRL